MGTIFSLITFELKRLERRGPGISAQFIVMMTVPNQQEIND